MSNKEIALRLTEKIIDNREDEYYYTEVGVLNLYKRVLKEIKKLEKQEDYIPTQKIIDKIKEIQNEENLYAKTNIIKILEELLEDK